MTFIDLAQVRELSDSMIKRAEIRRQIQTRKSVQNNEPDRLADQLETAAGFMKAMADLIESKS